MDTNGTFAAFAGNEWIAAGTVAEIVAVLKPRFDRDPGEVVLVFEDATGRQVDFDLRGSLEEALARVAPRPAVRSPGRPKLGVVSREVSLLPRHWEWLEQQPNGASAALRRLVEEAAKRNGEAAQARRAREAMGRFLTAMSGNLPAYEEATRALYAADRAEFERHTAPWPLDLRRYLEAHSGEAFWTKA